MRCSFEPGIRWLNQDPEPPLRAGCEHLQHVREVIDALQVLDHDAHVTQVVAPDLLDELGVVTALDVDPAGLGHLGGPRGPGHRARPAPDRAAGGRGRLRPGQRHWAAFQQERAAVQREEPLPPEPVLQRHGVLLAGDHGAAEAAAGLLHDQPVDRLHLGRLRPGAALPARCEDVRAVIGVHRTGRYRTSRTALAEARRSWIRPPARFPKRAHGYSLAGRRRRVPPSGDGRVRERAHGYPRRGGARRRRVLARPADGGGSRGVVPPDYSSHFVTHPLCSPYYSWV